MTILCVMWPNTLLVSMLHAYYFTINHFTDQFAETNGNGMYEIVRIPAMFVLKK